MATVTEPAAPTITAPPRRGPLQAVPIVLREIPWDLYVRLCDADEHRKVKMAYLDGVLELMSPAYRHDGRSRLLGLFVAIVSEALGIDCTGAGGTTLRRVGAEEGKGAGKEPDESFYFANEPAIRHNTEIKLEVDPPPDLAIEVDNSRESTGSFPIHARLGVPELWIYNVETESLWFGQLQGDGTYAPIERSLSLPMFTPALVLEGLRLADGLPTSRWMRRLRDWARAELGPPPGRVAGP